MKGYLDAKELESYKKEDLQELAKQLGVDAEGTKKEIATRCAAVEVDIPDESELTEEDKRAAEEAAAEAAAKAEEEEAATELVRSLIPSLSVPLANSVTLSLNVSSAYKLPSAVFTDKSALIASAIFLGFP